MLNSRLVALQFSKGSDRLELLHFVEDNFYKNTIISAHCYVSINKQILLLSKLSSTFEVLDFFKEISYLPQ